MNIDYREVYLLSLCIFISSIFRQINRLNGRSLRAPIPPTDIRVNTVAKWFPCNIKGPQMVSNFYIQGSLEEKLPSLPDSINPLKLTTLSDRYRSFLNRVFLRSRNGRRNRGTSRQLEVFLAIAEAVIPITWMAPKPRICHR